MNRTAWNGLATVCILIGLSLGVVPLVQWFVADHESGVIRTLFGDQSGAWVWGTPAIVVALAVAGVFLFGTLGDKASK